VKKLLIGCAFVLVSCSSENSQVEAYSSSSFYPNSSCNGYGSSSSKNYSSSSSKDYSSSSVTPSSSSVALCNGIPYTVAEFCYNNSEVKTKCDGKSYNTNQFCSDDKIYTLCSGSIYDPSTEDCCGNSKYTISKEFCLRGNVYDKCGGNNYDPADKEFCYNNSTVGKYCGSVMNKYNPDLYECRPSVNANGIYLKEKIKDNDNNEYEVILIGEQTWMAENLNYNVSGSKCYDDLKSNCDIYGRLYDWATAMNLPTKCNENYCGTTSPHRGICPIGYHIPTDDDWDKLYHYADGTTSIVSNLYESTTAGRFLKAKNIWSGSGGAGYYQCDDKYGFSALPGGYANAPELNNGKYFVHMLSVGYWWTANQEKATSANCRRMENYTQYAKYEIGTRKELLINVRCIKD